MLTYSPNHRIDAQQALLHPYFEDLDRESMPATGEEFVGLPQDAIPEKYRKLFLAGLQLPEEAGIDEFDDTGLRPPKMVSFF